MLSAMCDLRFAIYDVRCAMYDLRFTIYDLRDGGANSPSVAEGVPEGRGSNIEVRFAIYETGDFRTSGPKAGL